MGETKLPWFPYHRLVGTFGTEADLRADVPPELEIKREYVVDLKTFLKGRPLELPGMGAREARNHVTSLIRQSWDRTMAARGMSKFEMAGGGIAWFFTKGQIEGDKAHFTDHKGKRRSKKVVGRSEKRNVYWHLGFQAKAKSADGWHVVLKVVIIFSQDGETPIDSDARMHRLRRGFCRNWWNPQWRDLTLAFISWLAGEGATIELDTGMAGPIVLAAAPFSLEIPIAFDDPPTKSVIPDEPSRPDEDAEEPQDVPIDDDEEWNEQDGDEADDDTLDDEGSPS